MKYCLPKTEKDANANATATARAQMLTIYIEEAHPVDEWRLAESKVEKELLENNDSPIAMHQNINERLQIANKFVKRKNLMCDVCVDSFDGDVLDRYQAWPERLYIIIDGYVVYKGGVGPFHYDLDEVEAWLEERYGKSKK